MPDLSPFLTNPEFPLALGFVVLAGLVRGFSGFGSAMILSPSLAWLYGPQIGVPLLLLLDFIIALQMAPGALKSGHPPTLKRLCPAALVGLPVGIWVLTILPADILRRIIAAVVLLVVVVMVLRPKRGAPGPGGAVAAGALSGLTNGASGMAGPPVILFFLAGSDTPATIRGSLSLYFLFTDFMGCLGLLIAGKMTLQIAGLALLMLLPLMAGALLGSVLFKRGASPAFYRILALGIVGAVGVMGLLL
jgi:uncharacterized membrane protein YfcA